MALNVTLDLNFIIFFWPLFECLQIFCLKRIIRNKYQKIDPLTL